MLNVTSSQLFSNEKVISDDPNIIQPFENYQEFVMLVTLKFLCVQMLRETKLIFVMCQIFKQVLIEVHLLTLRGGEETSIGR